MTGRKLAKGVFDVRGYSEPESKINEGPGRITELQK